MSLDVRMVGLEHLSSFDVIRVTDPGELGASSRISDRLPPSGRPYKYRLRDRGLWRMRFDDPILSVATRGAGAMLVSYGESRFATEVTIDGDDGDLFCLTMPLQGEMTLVQDGVPTTGTVACGMVYRPGPRTRLLINGVSLRANVFLKVAKDEEALEHILDQRLRRPLEFRPDLDWTRGLTASLRGQLDYVMQEFQRPDGVAANAVALASTTDLLTTLLLHAVPHNHADQLEVGRGGAIPAYVRRAEDFMRANSAEPIHIAQVAEASGCSVRTLNSVFQHFRGTTPLAALHAIRLERVRDELALGVTGASIATVAHRYGFTNLARFGAAFRRRFNETPSELLRRASRP
ncbi:helix-turn-helix transcriptional regulator [Roseomonas sp. CAU 1739]|uniref:AraC family transcriptional regulator n=1 Tax=Roseomonas sp. CAU 1739 TaxID=3140364 RepID=UPI00325C214D